MAERETMRPHAPADGPRDTLGPRRKGRTFGGDIMRGEGNVPADGLGPGQRNRKADAIPGGGGGPNSAHRLFSQKMAARHAQNASLAQGLTVGTTIHPYDGTDPDTVASGSGTSIFDPVLCEMAYRWFCPPGGLVLDPFAGGSVRGIVAAKLGRAYVGIDLRPEQIEANRRQARLICKDDPIMPQWLVGDALDIEKLTDPYDDADFLFSCPPYADLEVYSDDPRDVSTMAYPDFIAVMTKVIAGACARLKENRFACFVVGDARGADGFYYGLPGDTAMMFELAGLRLYNEAILVTSAGSLPIRVRRQFEAGRKFGKTHQNILVFCKGDPRKATEAVGEVETGDIEGAALPGAAPSGGLGGEV